MDRLNKVAAKCKPTFASRCLCGNEQKEIGKNLTTAIVAKDIWQTSEKNVYAGYLSSAEPRSSSEKKFEKFCESCSAVDWFYKNGDKGDEYFSIVYVDNSNHQKLFYPDYIVSVKGKVWIVETKGGFSKSGESEDIDIFSSKKFKVLKTYLDKHKLKGGFVRYDKQSDELFICTDNYNDEIQSEAWLLLREIIC